MTTAHAGHGANAVAIRAYHFALGDLALSLLNAFRVADVYLFAAGNVVKLKRGGVSLIPTVHAAPLQFVGIQPVSNALRSLICLSVNPLSVPRLSKPALTPRGPLFW